MNKLGIGDWGMGFGDWGMGLCPRSHYPITNPPNPITQSLLFFLTFFIFILNLYIKSNIKINENIFIIFLHYIEMGIGSFWFSTTVFA